MNIREATAMELLKTFAPGGAQFLDLQILRSAMEAKGYDLKLIAHLAERRLFGRIFSQLVLRTGEQENLNEYGQALGLVDPAKVSPYVGSDLQNSKIDAALANSGITEGTKRYGEGAATFFSARISIPQEIRSTPIAVIGYGASGILISYALRQTGFNNITVYDKSAALGIWDYEHVYQLSRNNPAKLQFYDRVLDPAPGDGDEVRNFLANLISEDVVQKKVSGLEPQRRFQNVVHLDRGKTAKYPIVINTIGLGKPKPVSNPDKMTTTTPTKAGLRWQTKLDPFEAEGKTIILIGLGNSTAEMLNQIHALIDRGYAIDYRVLTHYPAQSVWNPSSYVPAEGRMYRVFRDTSKPNLVDYQGDLAHSRYDYFRALHNDRIIPGVKSWAVEKSGLLSIKDAAGELIQQLGFEKIMTLIGYQQPKETLTAMGCAYNDEGGHGVFDYDGEVAAKPGAVNSTTRLHKGCFGFGSVLETPLNPNAIVIPGMLHRIGDLLFGVIMRASEYNKTKLLKR